MSATVSMPAPGRWIALLVRRQPHQVIGEHDAPYLLRWFLIPHNPIANIYLHKFLRSDNDSALHDHPWAFLSVILGRGYKEITKGGIRLRRPGSIALRRATHRHRVSLSRNAAGSEIPCWTVIVTGPRLRQWGFWCTQSSPHPDKFIPWREFGAGGCGETDHRFAGIEVRQK
jgi:hypothetical protein